MGRSLNRWFFISFVFSAVLSFGQNPTIELARKYFEQGEYENAIPLFEEEYKNHAKLFQPLFECYVQTKSYSKAEKLINKQQKKVGKKNAQLFVQHIYIQVLDKNSKKATKYEDDLLEIIAQNPGMAGNVSQICAKYGLYKTGLNVINLAEEKLPNLNLGYQKALLYADMGDLESMFDEYLNLLNTNPGYLSLVKTTLSQTLDEDGQGDLNLMFKIKIIQKIQQTDNILFVQLLVWVYSFEENFSGVYKQLNALEKRGFDQSSQFLKFSKEAAEVGDFDYAAKFANQVIKKGDAHQLYEQALSQNLFNQLKQLNDSPESNEKDYQKWLDNSDKVLKEIPVEKEPITLKQGEVLARELNQLDKAEKKFQSVIDQSFSGSRFYNLAKMEMAALLLQKGEYAEALIAFALVENLNRETPMGQEAKFWKGKVAYYRGDFEYAETQFNVLKASTSKLIANDAMYMWLLIKSNSGLDTNTVAMETFAAADLALYRKLPLQALTIIDQLKVQFPGHPLLDDALFLEAKAYLEMKDLEKAFGKFAELIQQHPKSLLADEALIIWGRTLQSIKREEEAMAVYQQLLTDFPNSLFAEEARKRYRTLRGDEVVQ